MTTQRARWVIGALTAAPLVACTFLEPEVGSENAVCDGGCSAAEAAATTEAGAGADADAASFIDGKLLVSFARDIRPIFDRLSGDPRGPGCASCHYRSAVDPIGIQRGGLDLTTLGSLRMGGVTSGATIVVAGRPDDSAIVQKLRGTYFTGKRMPYDGPPYLTDAEIQIVADWIAQGAVGADSE
jgi:mono/diheme cytochrome c family protein